MNTCSLQAPSRKSVVLSDPAVMAWALVVAVALLSFFVHVLNEQVQRGHSWREQFRVAGTLPPPPAAAPAAQKPRALRLADATPARQPAATR